MRSPSTGSGPGVQTWLGVPRKQWQPCRHDLYHLLPQHCRFAGVLRKLFCRWHRGR
ncbi:MAG: hypothetical protein DCE88_14310, partial [Betaproteobacteria bacterium]